MRRRRPTALVRLARAAAAAGLAAALAGAIPAPSSAATDPVRAAVKRALANDSIDGARAHRYLAELAAARSTLRRLSGARSRQLGYVLGVARRVAGRGALTPSRMPAVFETIRRNREWWTTRGVPPAHFRFTFPGTHAVWQFYPGRGMQLQPLATFGKANAFWKRGDPAGNRALGELLDEMLGLASDRGGSPTWEYWFEFGGGRPPWASSIAQGTAIQALTRGALRLGRSQYVDAARHALGVFRARTPLGVRVPLASGGDWLALYSFDPGLRVLNAHVQALNGLFDLATLGGAAEARPIFEAGLGAVRRRISRFDTGAWSTYAEGGTEARLEYHRLNRDVLQGLCDRTAEQAICNAATRFTTYLHTPPEMTGTTVGAAHRGRLFGVRTRVSKLGNLRAYVRRDAGGPVLSSGLRGGYRGVRRIVLRAPRHPGTYRVELRATDPAGNVGTRTLAVRVR